MAVHYDLYGETDKPLLVFLHGGGVSSWMWEEQVNYFIDYRCLVPDLPGHGKSGGGSGFSIRDTADRITAIIEEHKSDQEVTVIGFSLGAQVLISMLSERDDLIDKGVIISAAVKPFAYPKMIAKLAAWMLPLARNRAFSRMQAKYMYLNNRHFNDYYHETIAMTKETFFDVMYENMSFTIPEGFRAARSDILVLIGEKENSIIKKSFAAILESNESCCGVVLPGVGHGITLHDSAHFNELIEQWIENGEIPDGKVGCNAG